jgi:hypothetical protein
MPSSCSGRVLRGCEKYFNRVSIADSPIPPSRLFQEIILTVLLTEHNILPVSISAITFPQYQGIAVGKVHDE